jgi:hypothetical protein
MRRRNLLLVLAVVIIAALFLWKRERPLPPREAPVVAAYVAPPLVEAPPPDPGPGNEETPPATPPPGSEAMREPLPPIIDDILVEPPAVCDGDETLVTVKARTAGGAEDAYLHYAVGAELGAQVPLRVFAGDDSEGAPPPTMVRVFGRNNVVTERPLPPVRVLSCKPRRRVHIGARILPNTIDELELTARIVDVTATEPMRPVEARWSFGDGTSAVSPGPVITHDYSGRPQDTLYAQLLVAVEVVGADGERVLGRTSLQLLNPSFEHLAYRNLVLLYARMTPRFPELDADGVVRQAVRVWHHYPQPVTLTRVLRYAHTSDGASSADPAAVDAAALFGGSVIGPGGVEARVELDTAGGLFSHEYTLEGRAADGRPAMGAFSVLRPPDRPTKEKSTPVNDPLLKAKILRARELLKQAYVTDEDLIRLGARGAFDDLVQQAAGAPPTGQAPMPPAPAR